MIFKNIKILVNNPDPTQHKANVITNYILTESKIYNVDLFFSPQIEGQKLNITAEVSSTVPGFVKQNTTRVVNVTRTKDLPVTHVSVFGPQKFNYPIKDFSIF